MQRYFTDILCPEDKRFTLSGDDARHMTRVMRMKAGDSFIAVFKDQTAYRSVITDSGETDVEAIAEEKLDQTPELPIHVTIAQGLPKGDKLELVIQKATELGFSRMIPFKADRSIVKWDDKKGQKKTDRWQKIAREAAEQSHRTVIPDIATPVSFHDLVESFSNYDAVITAYEEQAKSGEKSNFSSVLSRLPEGSKLLVIVGPEGGLSEKEIDILEQHQAVSCGFGPRILRTETAPLYALAAISYHYELMR
ncbi:16S rRNA (uracil(1498)-N(3))-methyltransferase [Jeotgalibacillus sp. R-1-5s-1]|uniref:16S rRNA (uracil(1498)-N(3))-methyltransferase n=1 Tax=Jeotgalibacillus sp. R-1-5s-1 TaxID=2555897 RepID=UPI001069D116|nr:16S rRNA (uracil(1498)-N(3))-methyltransferase [Jeotgalibacillus sp. R-1-5s-1]TFD92337.1 16S rRNA (uracil(1498)-N(3))-methyltransferase [Jeotgalibacillus sp. R-1-5s-1]